MGFDSKRALEDVFMLPRWYLSMFWLQEGTKACVLAPGGLLRISFAPERAFSMRFSSQEGVLAHCFQQLGQEGDDCQS